MVAKIPLGLRFVALFIEVGTIILTLAQIIGFFLFGVLIGFLIWSVIDLIGNVFQDRPTQGVNSGISLIGTLSGFAFFQNIDPFIVFAGLVVGFALAFVLDYETKSK